jgi:hypothetical protein
MLGLLGDRFEDQQVERSVNEIGWFGHIPRLSTIVDNQQLESKPAWPENQTDSAIAAIDSLLA